MKNRYIIIKNIYPDYLILIKKNNKLISFYEDKLIYNIFEIKDVNYLILNNLHIEEMKEFVYNKYNEYYIKIKLIEIVNIIRKKGEFE